MGDLYQELDPVVKSRYALCQTPDFVRTFILDRTLTPAIETFGADEVRLLDPACGSGHFLIDGPNPVPSHAERVLPYAAQADERAHQRMVSRVNHVLNGSVAWSTEGKRSDVTCCKSGAARI